MERIGPSVPTAFLTVSCGILRDRQSVFSIQKTSARRPRFSVKIFVPDIPADACSVNLKNYAVSSSTKFLYRLPHRLHRSVILIQLKAFSLSARSPISSISEYSYRMHTENRFFLHFGQAIGCKAAGIDRGLSSESYPSQSLSKTGVSRPHLGQRAVRTTRSPSGKRLIPENGPRRTSPSASTAKSCAAQQVSCPSMTIPSPVFFSLAVSK